MQVQVQVQVQVRHLDEPLRHILRERAEVCCCRDVSSVMKKGGGGDVPAAVSQGSARALSCSHETVEHNMLRDFPVPVGDSKMPIRLFWRVSTMEVIRSF